MSNLTVCMKAEQRLRREKFTLTNAQGRTIEGRYFGELDPTFNPTSVTIHRWESWQARGVCIGTSAVQPARDLQSGHGNRSSRDRLVNFDSSKH